MSFPSAGFAGSSTAAGALHVRAASTGLLALFLSVAAIAVALLTAIFAAAGLAAGAPPDLSWPAAIVVVALTIPILYLIRANVRVGRAIGRAKDFEMRLTGDKLVFGCRAGMVELAASDVEAYCLCSSEIRMNLKTASLPRIEDPFVSARGNRIVLRTILLRDRARVEAMLGIFDKDFAARQKRSLGVIIDNLPV